MSDETRSEELSAVLRVSREPDDGEFDALISIIEQARARAFQAVNREMIEMYWRVGQHISGKLTSREWGKAVVKRFSAYVQRRYPGLSGFSPQNVWRMRAFYETYASNEKLSALTRQTTWTNNLLIMGRAKTEEAREY